jgi:hypothetical protein
VRSLFHEFGSFWFPSHQWQSDPCNRTQKLGLLRSRNNLPQWRYQNRPFPCRPLARKPKLFQDLDQSRTGWARPAPPEFFARRLPQVYTSDRTFMPQRFGSVFFSYARSDRDLVQKIGQELSEAGFEVWDPDQEILPGAS